MGLKFDDLMAFVKAGYKPNEIKELIDLTKESDTPTQLPVQEEAETTETEDVIPNDEEAVKKEDEPDYKKLYEESQEKLKKAQISNTQQNIKGTEGPSDQDMVDDLVRAFM